MTRVKLSIKDDDPSTDYINASFIKGYNDENEYIACQGPQKETCHDFYRMIIEQNVEVIVMLTDLFENNKEKCFKYYPNEGEVMLVNDIGIFCSDEEEFQFYRRRTLSLTKGEKDIVVTQFQYKQWGDFVCPSNTSDMILFCDLIRRTPHKGCILVHCSAGAGRTGTFIAIDILLQRVKNNQKINVFNTILKLRQQRVGMVQTEAQMGYVYECISQAIESSPGKSKETV
ncbi:hypothetical protein RUM44_006188 [Polyplax serrata]|uniref:protein-tyrosine-phosphatase n=1 Tax=Polyplax serrata TaxID=468196 RepID=A0ABR1AZ74_POLSC